MKLLKLTVIATTLSLVSCNNFQKKEVALNNEVDSVSYSLGVDMAAKVKQNFVEINNDAYIQGFTDALDSLELSVPLGEVQGVIRAYFQKQQQLSIQKRQEEALKRAEVEFAEEKEKGLKFLEENKTKSGVKVTASGLQYIVLKEGTGKQPSSPAASVTVHYHGTTPDGTVFDSSVERKSPYTTRLNAVIKGWTEGVQLMKEGAKYKFFVPQELAYGAFPRKGGAIKPFMPLVFEVELIKVNDK